MANKTSYNLTNNEIDMLTEAGNIAAGNAVTSLSKLLGKKLDMNIAKVRIENIQELPDALGDPETYIAGMLIDVEGDIKGMLLLALEPESAQKLVSLVLQESAHSIEEFNEFECSALCETGNILAGSYISALSTFTGLEPSISIPKMCIDMAGAILSVPAIEFARNDNTMLFIETTFREVDNVINGTYILILDTESFNKMVSLLGDMI